MTDDYLDGWWDACNGIANLLENMPMHVEGFESLTPREVLDRAIKVARDESEVAAK